MTNNWCFTWHKTVVLCFSSGFIFRPLNSGVCLLKGEKKSPWGLKYCTELLKTLCFIKWAALAALTGLFLLKCWRPWLRGVEFHLGKYFVLLGICWVSALPLFCSFNVNQDIALSFEQSLKALKTIYFSKKMFLKKSSWQAERFMPATLLFYKTPPTSPYPPHESQDIKDNLKEEGD